MADEELLRALERVVVSSGTITSRAFADVSPEIRTLTVHQYRVFALVACAPDGLRIVELARRSSSRPQATTRIVQRLEAKGLVVYVRGALIRDRRAVVVRLTDPGAQTWRGISDRRRELLQEALEGLALRPDTTELVGAIAEALERYIA
jgi:DNA-binding MarR family transcriptional regulator